MRLPYKSFGALRFILALLVLAQHFGNDLAPDAIKQALFPWAPGNIAVLGFFIVSGFIICEAHHNYYSDRPLAFLSNRLLRIVPAYWAALALSIIVHYMLLRTSGHLLSLDRHVIEDTQFSNINLIKNVLAIFPPFRVNTTSTEYPFIPYAWALQTEMLFYLSVFFVGVAHPYLKRFGCSQNVCLGIVAYAGIMAGVFELMGWAPKQFAFGSYFAFGGALFFVLFRTRQAWVVLVPALLEILWHFQTYAARDFVDTPANRPGQFLILALILISIIVLASLKLKPSSIDKKCGDLSYPLYLNHYVIAVLILNLAPRFSVPTLALGLAASLLLSHVMFRVVEKPLSHLRQTIRETVPDEPISGHT